jgi:pimeloyl-ACP methyl ester carboxylesterase
MADYENRYWQSTDGLKLHYRDYAAAEEGAGDQPLILCIPGLTRNARDFEALADRLSARRRVIAVDLRGRGESAYARDPMSYTPATYAGDIEQLLEEIGAPRVIVFGTSLGGIVTMLLALRAPDSIAGALLNDIGPQVEAAGLARIRGYVGKANSWPTWMHAARAVAEANAAAHPDYTIADWLVMAKRLYRLTSSGRIVLDYDMRIAEPFRTPGDGAGADLWPALEALKPVPTLIVHGALSDVLSDAVAQRMVAMLDDAELLTLPDVGHAPTLDEPAAVAAIERLLERTTREPAPR